VPNAAGGIRKALAWTISLYAISVLTTMAGMELFGWLSAFLVLVLLALKFSGKADLDAKLFLPVDWALLVLGFAIVIGTLMNAPITSDRGFALGSARWIFLLLFMRYGLQWTWSPRAERVMQILFILIGLIGIYSIFQYFYGIDFIRGARNEMQPFGQRADGRLYYRAEGMFGSCMRYGHSAAMAVCFPIAYYFLNNRKKLMVRLAGISAFLCVVSIVATLTRGAWLGAFAGVVAMIICAKPRAIKSFVVAGALMAALIYFEFPEIWSRTVTVGDAAYTSNIDRVSLWKANIEIFKDYPIFGIGYGVNEDVSGIYLDRLGFHETMRGHAHNNYLQFLAGTGIVGLICYLIYIGYFLIITFRLWQMIPAKEVFERSLVLGALGAQFALHFGGLTETTFKDAQTNHLFNLVIALVCMLYIKHGRPKLLARSC
jgi:O-antigen ligase